MGINYFFITVAVRSPAIPSAPITSKGDSGDWAVVVGRGVGNVVRGSVVVGIVVGTAVGSGVGGSFTVNFLMPMNPLGSLKETS